MNSSETTIETLAPPMTRNGLRRGLVVIAGAMLVLLVGLRSCVTMVDYVLPPEARTGWYVLDQGRSECQKPARGWLGQQVMEFSPDGYLCTSSPPGIGLHYWRYFLRTPEGDLQELEIGTDIIARTTLGPTEGGVYSFGEGTVREPCRAAGEAFRFGRVAGTEEGYLDVLARHRPECGND